MTRTAGRFVPPEVVFFLAAWVAVLVVFREKAFHDPGAYWHIRVGDLILDRGLPHADPFTYTFAGAAWVPQQWGAEVVMSVAHRVGGFDTLLTGFAVVVAGLFAGVFGRLLRGGMGWPVAAGVAVVAFGVGSFHYYARPHLTTFVFLAWTAACLVDFDRGRAGMSRLAGLIPVCVVWTNLHGGVLGGVMTLGLAAAGWVGLFLLGRDSPVKSWRAAAVLGGVVLACALTPFVNPFGLDMLRIWWGIVASPVLPEIVAEHRPADFEHPATRAIFAFGALYAFVLAGTLPRFPRVTWLLPLVWLALTLKGIRQGPLFAVVAGVVLADVWPHTVWFRLLKKSGDTLAREPAADGDAGPGWRAWVLPAAVVLAAVGVQAAGVAIPVVGRGWAGAGPDAFPVDLTEPIRAAYAAAGPDARLYNDANFGGYLLYHFPGRKIFMDDRCELYGDDWLRDYVEVVWSHPDRIETWADRYGFGLALVASPPGPDAQPLDAYLAASPRWKLVAAGEQAKLYARVPSPPHGPPP